jgi:hypothetical protein
LLPFKATGRRGIVTGVARMPLWLRWSLISATALAVMVTVLLAVANRSLAGPRKPVETLFVPPTDVQMLAGEQWQEGQSLAEDSLMVRRWQNVRTRTTFVQEVTTHTSGFGSLYDYTAADPRINDREDFGNEGVHDASLDVTLKADQARIYCRQLIQGGRSSDTCSGWVYWSRYGRYTIEIAYHEPGLDAHRFTQIVEQIDAKIAATLSR